MDCGNGQNKTFKVSMRALLVGSAFIIAGNIK